MKKKFFLGLTLAVSLLLTVTLIISCYLDDNSGTGFGNGLKAINGGKEDIVPEIKMYNLSIRPNPENGGNVARVPDAGSYAEGATVTVIATAKEEDGYRFTGWMGTASSPDPVFAFSMDGNMELIANFELKTYTLTISQNIVEGGSVSRGTSVCKHGERVTVTATPASGYAFVCWSGASASQDREVTVTMDRDMELAALFQKEEEITRQLSVSTNPPNGGTAARVPDKDFYDNGEHVTVIATAKEEDGYRFTGWVGTASSPDPVFAFSMDGNMELIANFELKTYTLTISQNMVEGGSVSRGTSVCKHGERVTVTATPASGYTFVCWSGASTSQNREITVNMDRDMELTALFQKEGVITRLLSFSTNPPNGGSVSRIPNKDFYDNGEYVTVTATAAAGYRFTRWSGASTADNPNAVILMNGNKTLTANFEQLTYTLTTNPGNGGTISRDKPGPYTYGAVVTLTANENSGYEFAYWTGDAAGSTKVIPVTMDRNKTVGAVFQRMTYTLTVDRHPTAGGAVTGGGTFEHGAYAIITAKENSGYRFTGWTPTDGVTDPSALSTTVHMTQNRAVTANFVQRHTLIVNPNPTAGGTVTGGGTFDHGTSATIAVTTVNPGYRFTGWTPIEGIANLYSPNTIVSMTQNRTVTANFEQIPYILTASASPTGGGSVSRSPNQENYTYGTQVIVTATANTGYTFDKWSGASTSANRSVAITMDDNKTLTANFNIDMVFVQGGTFTMGCTPELEYCYSREKPAHQVTLTKDFYIGKYLVTQAQWIAVMGSNPSYFNGDNLPVQQVSWYDVQEFITKLNAVTGKMYRLPTEAEWEYAARGGNKSAGYKYAGSNNIDAVAWYGDTDNNGPKSVGTKQANELGIYDMTGNAWEWVSDWWGDYSSGAQTNPSGPSSGFDRVIRGGSWNNDARACQVSYRHNDPPANRGYSVGFRLALSP